MLTTHELEALDNAVNELYSAIGRIREAVASDDQDEADTHIGLAFGSIGEGERLLGKARDLMNRRQQLA